MTPEQRYNASIDQSLVYLQGYYAEWRLAKVLTNKKLLQDRYNFYSDLSKEIKQWDDENGEATIAQEIRNGLYFDSIAQCFQYIEDLFALIKASKKPDYFIRNVVTYRAGEVTNMIKGFTSNGKSITKAFHIPEDIEFSNVESQNIYDLGIAKLVTLVDALKHFYKSYWFLYNQYKHGLAVGMRPFGNLYDKGQIEKDKRGELEPYLVVYDNINLQGAKKKGSFMEEHGLFMPCFTNNVRPYFPELIKSNNFLRFVYPPDYPIFKYDILVDIAYKARCCIKTFIVNYSRSIKLDEGVRAFQLPDEYKLDTYFSCKL